MLSLTVAAFTRELPFDFRGDSEASMRERITSLVSEVVEEKLSEEEVLALIDLGGSAGGPEGIHWVLDPIDGTRGFVGGRQYAVCLGMIKDGQVNQHGLLLWWSIQIARE